ncbi:MAG: aminoacyl-tRNA hydrolase [Patescibacteria group bacterium]|jgi:PTH1 family peptidyl-tRNA hydrolase
MKIIVGLGNPGINYEKTRHNVGFMAIDRIQSAFDLPNFSVNKKLHAAVSKGKIGRTIVVLLKPETFMNDSGVSVAAALSFFKTTIDNLIVIHDDKDIVLGETRVQVGRGDAGHNGVKSIIEKIGTKDFRRLRIGIEPEDEIILDTADFVLRRFSSDETKKLNKVLDNVTVEIKEFV